MLVFTATEVLVLQLTLTPKFNQPSIIISLKLSTKTTAVLSLTLLLLLLKYYYYYYPKRAEILYGDQGDLERSEKVSTTHLVQVYPSLTQAANANEP